MPFKKNDPQTKAWQRAGGKASVESRNRWDSMRLYFENEGARKIMEALDGLEGKEYLEKVVPFIEFHKPKLARTENKNDNNNKIEMKIVVQSEEGANALKKLTE